VLYQPAELSPAEVKAELEALFPELSRAEIIENPDGSVTFQVRAANKGNGGQVKYIYGSNTIYQPAELTAEEVKAELETVFPELSRADIIHNADGSVTFQVRAANKGA